jgi:hypothetical protein
MDRFAELEGRAAKWAYELKAPGLQSNIPTALGAGKLHLPTSNLCARKGGKPAARILFLHAVMSY